MLRFLMLIAGLAVGLLAGCGGDSGQSADSTACGCEDGCGCEDEGCGDGAEAFDAAKATATIKGVVKWSGKVPRRTTIKMGGDKFCGAAHSDDMLSETWSIDGDKLQNVFVQVKSGHKGWKFATPTEKKLLDQVGCMYQPHVSGIMVGQGLTIRNSDPTTHNVHATPVGSTKTTFNFGQINKGQENVKSFRRPGRYYIKCDVHGWMSCYVIATRHPFYDVSGKDGSFELKLPPGEYEIEAWHERAGAKTQTVKVGDGETKEITFTYSR